MTEEVTLSEVHRVVLEVKELLIGNGQPGVITRLAKVEAVLETGGKKTAINAGGISAVIAAIVAGIIAGFAAKQ